MAFNGILADLAALAAVDITDPKGDGSVSLSPGVFVQVESPGNGSPPTWFTLENESWITNNIHNWAVIAGSRTGNEVWIGSNGITASNNTPPSVNLPAKYAGTEWRSKYIYEGGIDTVEIMEVWVYTGTAWHYRPSVIDYSEPQPLTTNPIGRGQIMYEGTRTSIANYDLSGWTLLVETGGVS